jgi:hypothetical protein
MWGVRLGKVFGVNYVANTVDVLMGCGLGTLLSVPVASSLASTKTGTFEMPVLKTVDSRKGTMDVIDGKGGIDKENLYSLENTVYGKSDLDDPTTNYVYAIIVLMDENTGKDNPICLGFVYPHRNQILFDPDDVPPNVPQYVKDAITKLAKGGLLHRTNSDVYWTVDVEGNMEWAHPNGSFFRIAETPTFDTDGAWHVPLDGANAKGRNKGQATNLAWNTKLGPNKDRKLYAHFEVVTEKGTVEIDIDKKTGNVSIKTPQNSADADSADTNKVSIICGGDALLQTVKGNVTIEAVEKEIFITAKTNITVETKDNGDSSIMLAPGSSPDYLPLFTKLAQKFNSHTHRCPKHGPTSGPDKTLEQGDDSTNVTKAG